LENIVITIAHTLFIKQIPFCLYRFPFQTKFNIAIDENYLPHSPKETFWLAPFYNKSDDENILLSVLSDEFINKKFLYQLQQLPQLTTTINYDIPKETTIEEYNKSFDAYIKNIQSGKIHKAILSRVLYENKPENFDVFECFKQLATSYQNTFVHISLHSKSGIWLGATPELLIKKTDTNIAIMALAGTQAKNNSGNYTWRQKEIQEHVMVCKHIEEVAEKFHCTLIEKIEPHTVQAAYVVHLKTDYVYKENINFNLKNFLHALHPTPAIGGLPIKESIECILQNENYDRKYYCGFIGTTNFSTQADLYINLRCMQIGENKIAIYVGGGITASSNVDEEWKETELKSKTMLAIIHSA